MLHEIIKNILKNKLDSGFICFITFKDGIDIVEKPFKPSDQNVNLDQPNIQLVNCVTNKVENLSAESILGFRILHESNLNDSTKASNEIVNLYKKNSTIYDFINGDLYYKIAFNIKSHTNKKIIPVMNAIRSTNIDDYDKFIAGDPAILDMVKRRIKEEIMKRYAEIIDSLNKELNLATDQSIKDELNSIKNILSLIPQEIEVELASKVKYDDIITYWPTLLLPRVNLKFPVYIPDFGFEFN